jgi:polygalacturonase
MTAQPRTFELPDGTEYLAFDVEDFDAVPDGVTDCTSAFQASITAACQWNEEHPHLPAAGIQFHHGTYQLKGRARSNSKNM